MLLVVNNRLFWVKVIVYSCQGRCCFSQRCLFFSVKVAIKSFVLIAPLLGLTWIFGVLAFTEHLLFFHYLFALTNSLQGVFILVFCVCLSTEVSLIKCLNILFGGFANRAICSKWKSKKEFKKFKKYFDQEISKYKSLDNYKFDLYNIYKNTRLSNSSKEAQLRKVFNSFPSYAKISDLKEYYNKLSVNTKKMIYPKASSGCLKDIKTYNKKDSKRKQIRVKERRMNALLFPKFRRESRISKPYMKL